MSILQKLTEGVVSRDMRKEGAALLNKWEQTGLLEGLQTDAQKNNMARLLENQAKQLLKEAASSMAGGDVEGFAAVAFPIVRRVFGGLIANDLVSVQPMSLPSGLIFFLDFTFGGTNPTDTSRLGFGANDSLYGGGVVGSQLTGGATLNGENGTGGGQLYNLTNGYSSPTASYANGEICFFDGDIAVLFSGTFGSPANTADVGDSFNGGTGGVTQAVSDHISSILRYDPSIVSGTTNVAIASIARSALTGTNGTEFNFDDLVAVTLTGGDLDNGTANHLRRLTQFSQSVADKRSGNSPARGTADLLVVVASDTATPVELSADILAAGLTFPIVDNFTTSQALGSVVGADAFGLENSVDIPEINLKVDSVSVTAVTKKLKAKWTPELGQDLNAYHNLDAEVELTSILSEQIALEIDREILEDLVKGATAGKYYWSRSPGLFVDRVTGAEVGAGVAAPDFTGTVSEWYETLGETINDISAQIHRKTLRGGANFIVTSPEVSAILEFTAGFRANVTHDDATGAAGAQQVGTLSKRYDVYVDPYFPRNLLLVGRKGGSFLESGYVYAPYVPLQVTPTIFGVEDFVPRKGVMTRYAKKMVRPDMYGLVICRGLLGESGAAS
mgnify:CR=1 FL=1